MTENQEKELLITLGSLVKGVSEIQSDLRSIKTTLDEHSKKLDRVDAKTDSIAGQLIKNDVAINERVSAVERSIEGSEGKIH